MHALTPLLLDAAIKATVILIVAALVVAAMRRSSAAARHLVWTLAIVGTLSLPAMSYFLPGLAVLPASPMITLGDEAVPSSADHARPDSDALTDERLSEPDHHVDAGPAAPRTADAAAPRHGHASAPSAATQPPSPRVDDPASASTQVDSDPAAPPTAQADTPRSLWASLLPWLPWIWLGGASFALLPIILGAAALARLKRCSRPITAGSWQSLLTRCQQQIGLTRRVTLRRSSRPIMPMTWGGYLPLPGVVSSATILLPPESDAWSAERRRAVLLHELAHVKRCDCLTQTLTQLACALYWFNPLVWFAGQRMLVERERACDDMVLLNETKPSDYAEHLLEIATGPQAGFFAAHAGIAMARRSKLDGRLAAILDQHRNRRAMSRVGVALTITLLGAVVVPVAMLQGADTRRSHHPEDEAVADAAPPIVSVDPPFLQLLMHAVEPGDLVTIKLVSPVPGSQAWANLITRDVRADGRLDLPELGRIEVEGLTTVQIQERVRTTLLKETGVEPVEVRVLVQPAAHPTYAVIGGRRGPVTGVYPLDQPGMTVTSAIAIARGVRNDTHSVHVYRRDSDNARGEPKHQRTEISWQDLLAGDAEADLAIRPGDVIHVPERRSHFIYLAGQVRRPGAYVLPEQGMTLLQLIAAGENLRLGAVPVEVEIVRQQADGSERRLPRIRADALLEGEAENPRLEPGDVVIVRPDPPAVRQREIDNLRQQRRGLEHLGEDVEPRAPAEAGEDGANGPLAPGDVISVQIFELLQAGRDHVESLRLDAAGQIRLPILGTVEAGGRTRDELEEHIAERLRDAGVLRRSSVRVRVWQRHEGDAPFEDPVIEPGDRLQLRIHELERPGQDWGQRVEVDDQGRIELPQLGVVEIAGLTTAEAEDHLHQRLSEAEILRNALVRITPEAVLHAPRLSVLPQRITLLENQLQRIEAQLEAGRVSVDELAAARSRVAEARIELADLLGDREQAVTELEQLITMQQQRVERLRRLVEAGRAAPDAVAEAELELRGLQLRLERRKQALPADDDAEDQPNAREEAHLPDIRVVAIGRNPHEENRWHLPDGTPLASQPFAELLRFTLVDEPAEVAAVLLSHRPRNSGAYALAYEFDWPRPFFADRLDVAIEPAGADDPPLAADRGWVYLFAFWRMPEELSIRARIADLTRAEQVAQWRPDTGRQHHGQLNASFHDLHIRELDEGFHVLRFQIEHDAIDEHTQHLSAVLRFADGRTVRRLAHADVKLGESRTRSRVVIPLAPEAVGPEPELREVKLERAPRTWRLLRAPLEARPRRDG